MKTIIRSTLAALIGLICFVGWNAAPAQAAGAVTLTANADTVVGGDTFTVYVNVDETPELFGAQLSLTYDNTRLNVVEVQAGPVWPAGKTFVARNTFTAGGTSAERIEFAATLLDSSLTVPGGVLAAVVFEAISPAETVTTAIGNGSALPLMLANVNGFEIASAQPAGLEITVTPPPPAEVAGAVALQAAAGEMVTIELSGLNVNTSTRVAAGSTFSLTVPEGDYSLTVSAECHADAHLEGVSAPTNDLNVTLAAGDVNGDGQINIQDVSAVGYLYGATGVTGCADLTGTTGTVDLFDITLVAGNFGK